MRLFFVLVFSFLGLSIYAQIDQHKLDSLSHSIDSTAQAYKTWQDSFAKVQDSVYESSVRPLRDSLTHKADAAKQKEAERRKEALVRIAIGVLLFVVLVILLMRKRKQQN